MLASDRAAGSRCCANNPYMPTILAPSPTGLGEVDDVGPVNAHLVFAVLFRPVERTVREADQLVPFGAGHREARDADTGADSVHLVIGSVRPAAAAPTPTSTPTPTRTVHHHERTRDSSKT
jgi:hypothetical protein